MSDRDARAPPSDRPQVGDIQEGPPGHTVDLSPVPPQRLVALSERTALEEGSCTTPSDSCPTLQAASPLDRDPSIQARERRSRTEVAPPRTSLAHPQRYGVRRLVLEQPGGSPSSSPAPLGRLTQPPAQGPLSPQQTDCSRTPSRDGFPRHLFARPRDREVTLRPRLGDTDPLPIRVRAARVHDSALSLRHTGGGGR